jgi:hypothetical protein
LERTRRRINRKKKIRIEKQVQIMVRKMRTKRRKE